MSKYAYNGESLTKEVVSSALTNSQTINYTFASSGVKTWTVTAHYNAGEQPLDSTGANYDSPYPAGTMPKSISVEAVYPLYATVTSITSFSELPLKPASTKIYEVVMVAETDTNRHTFRSPVAIGEIKGIKYLNPVSGKYEYMNGSDVASLNAFSRSTINIGGIQYYEYKRLGSKGGKITLQFHI